MKKRRKWWMPSSRARQGEKSATVRIFVRNGGMEIVQIGPEKQELTQSKEEYRCTRLKSPSEARFLAKAAYYRLLLRR